MEKPVIIFGSKGIAKAALEIFNSNGIVTYGFLDDDEHAHNKEINTVPVLGATDDHGFLKLVGKKCEAFVATDDNVMRKEFVSFLNDSRKVMPVNAVHQTAHLAASFQLGHGNFVNAAVVLANDSNMKSHNIIHTGVKIEQEVEIGSFVQIGTGTTVNANVTIEDEVFIGSGVTVVAGLTLGKGARIGAGSVVVSDVNQGETVFGNPAQRVNK